jgi:hypothetical protein
MGAASFYGGPDSYRDIKDTADSRKKLLIIGFLVLNKIIIFFETK